MKCVPLSAIEYIVHRAISLPSPKVSIDSEPNGWLKISMPVAADLDCSESNLRSSTATTSHSQTGQPGRDCPLGSCAGQSAITSGSIGILDTRLAAR